MTLCITKGQGYTYSPPPPRAQSQYNNTVNSANAECALCRWSSDANRKSPNEQVFSLRGYLHSHGLPVTSPPAPNSHVRVILASMPTLSMGRLPHQPVGPVLSLCKKSTNTESSFEFHNRSFEY